MPLTPLVAPLVLMGVAMPLHESPFFFSSRGWNLCSYNVLIHSHVIIMGLTFWGDVYITTQRECPDFRSLEVSISVNVDFLE